MDGPFDAVLNDWLASGYGLQSASFGAGAIEEAIKRRSRALGLARPEGYPALWRGRAGERLALLDELLVGQTWFFREPLAFERLASWLRSRLHAFSEEAPLRVLSLPCSTGEEAWSIAAVVADAGLPSTAVRIEAIDLSPSALAQAARGIYPGRKLRGEPPARWTRHLIPHPEGWRIDERLRSMVHFKWGNALDPKLFRGCPPYHLLFCRNMLIYMARPAREQVCRSLSRVLRPEGLLFLGHAEHPSGEPRLIRSAGAGTFAWGWAPGHSDARGESAAARFGGGDREPARPIPPTSLPNPVERRALPLAPPPEPLPPIDLRPIRELADRGFHEEALARLEPAGEWALLDPEFHCLAGILLGALKRTPEAVARLRRALYLDPAHRESLAHLALLLERQGELEAAQRLHRRLEQLTVLEA